MNKEKDYLANDLINQKYFSSMTDTIENPNHSWVLENTINALPPKKKFIKDSRPIYNTISGIDSLNEYDSFYKLFRHGMHKSTFFTSNNVEKVESLFPEYYTLKSVNNLISIDINEYKDVVQIVSSNKHIINWVIIKKSDNPLLIENHPINMSFIILFTITENSFKCYFYDKGSLIYNNYKKNLPDDFTSQFGNVFYHDKILPQVNAILRKGLMKYLQTLVTDNGMRFKKNFILFSPLEVNFELDMNYKPFIQYIDTPSDSTNHLTEMYETDINNVIYSPDAPNSFNLILNESVYIPHAPEEVLKKQKKQENINETPEKKSSIVSSISDELGDLKWVIISIVLILIIGIITIR
jgi:hypothetical protein